MVAILPAGMSYQEASISNGTTNIRKFIGKEMPAIFT
jgi:hypothetical protein